MNKSPISKEDALTTSTESETFDTWTVITNQPTNLISEKIPSPPPTPDKMEPDTESTEDALRVEILSINENDDQSVIRFTNQSQARANNSLFLFFDRYVDSDDLSDGISIISECDSIGRISPQLRKHVSELNMRFVDVIESPLRMTRSVAGGDATSRFYEASSEHSSDGFHHMEPLMENNRRKPRASRQLADSSTHSRPTLRIKGLFIIGALLGILALVSKQRYEAMLGNTNTAEPYPKIDELELQHHLMRAEIDILAKQVNYLSAIAEELKYFDFNKSKNSKQKKMKVWPGNGNIVEDIEINPKDLKKPFKCNGHNNVDIAGACIEIPNSAESLVDSLCEKVRTVIEESEQFGKIEKIVDTTAKTTEKDDDAIEENSKPSPKESQQNQPENTPQEHKSDNKKYDKKREPIKRQKNVDHSDESREQYHRKDRSSEDTGGSGERLKKSKDHKKYDKYEYENAKKDADEKIVDKTAKPTGRLEKDDDTTQEDSKPSPKESQKNKPEYTPHEHKSDKYENKKYDSKRETLKKHKNDDHSGESGEKYHRKDRSSEDFDDSGERIKKSKDHKKYDKFSSGEYEKAKKDADGQWHEKLMKHRENSRKTNDKQRRDKNWYIERGDSREQARATEEKYR